MTRDEAITLSNCIDTALKALASQGSAVKRMADYRQGSTEAYIKIGNINSAIIGLSLFQDDLQQEHKFTTGE